MEQTLWQMHHTIGSLWIQKLQVFQLNSPHCLRHVEAAFVSAHRPDNIEH